jgi:hypothetical protein
MENHNRIFANLEQKMPPKGLETAIFARILREKRQGARIRLFWTSASAALSFAAIIPAVKFLITQFVQSGFYQYISLVFSDSSVILSVWKELALSLAESFPVMETALVLTLVLIVLGSVRYIVRDSKLLLRTQLA